jgi:hypothetical protein|tara:strand:+ start:315 stop:584 length:270 start_codon:yes stop_codon:yes gene_type:complete
MARPKGIGRITTSVTVSPEFFNMAKEHRLSFTEAIRIGLSLMFAERNLKPYDNKLNLYRKMQLFQAKAEELSNELETIKQHDERKGTNG